MNVLPNYVADPVAASKKMPRTPPRTARFASDSDSSDDEGTHRMKQSGNLKWKTPAVMDAPAPGDEPRPLASLLRLNVRNQPIQLPLIYVNDETDMFLLFRKLAGQDVSDYSFKVDENNPRIIYITCPKDELENENFLMTIFKGYDQNDKTLNLFRKKLIEMNGGTADADAPEGKHTMVLELYFPVKDEKDSDWVCTMIDEKDGKTVTMTNKWVTDAGNYVLLHFRRDDVGKGGVKRVTKENCTPTRAQAKPVG